MWDSDSGVIPGEGETDGGAEGARGRGRRPSDGDPGVCQSESESVGRGSVGSYRISHRNPYFTPGQGFYTRIRPGVGIVVILSPLLRGRGSDSGVKATARPTPL
jgi:hypothetical protein